MFFIKDFIETAIDCVRTAKESRKNFLFKTSQDLYIIKLFKETYPDYPLIIPDKEDTLYILYLIREAMYKKFYFPHFQVNKLKNSEKMQYIFLRAEIDKVLDIRGNKYII